MNEKNNVASPHTVRMVSTKKSTTISAGEDIEGKEPSSLLVGIKVGNPRRRTEKRLIKN